MMAALVEAGFMAAVSGTAGSVIGAEAWPAVLLSSSWLVFVAPLRAFRAFEALLKVVFFTGFDTLAGSTVLALVSVAALPVQGAKPKSQTRIEYSRAVRQVT